MKGRVLNMSLTVLEQEKVSRINRLRNYLIPPKPVDSPRLRTITIVGYMESGKTTMAKSIYHKIKKYIYERYDNPVGIYTNNLLYLVENLDELEGYDYYYIIVDDAALFQHARRAMSNVTFNILLKYSRKMNGINAILIISMANNAFNRL